MTEQEVKTLYESEKPLYKAWGDFIQKQIEDELSKSVDINSSFVE